MSCQRFLRGHFVSTGYVKQLIIGSGCRRHLNTLVGSTQGITRVQHCDSLRGGLVVTRRASCVTGHRFKGAGGFHIDPKESQGLQCGLFWVPCRSAGHSKWQNIKHTKEAKDAARGVLFAKLARQMKVAIMVGKSNDPKFNNQLAHAVDEAKKAMMPMAKIEAQLKAENSKAAIEHFTMEAKGPGGCFIIIELLTDNINRTRNNIKYILRKQGVTFTEGIKHLFSYKGVVAVEPEASNLTLETAVDVAIDVGAEEVVEATENDGTPVLQFLCEPRDFFKVKTALSEKGYSLKTSKLCYLPERKVTLSDEHLEVMGTICELLDSHEDVDAFYDNVE